MRLPSMLLTSFIWYMISDSLYTLFPLGWQDWAMYNLGGIGLVLMFIVNYFFDLKEKKEVK